MSDIKWSETHCPFCKLLLWTNELEDEGKRIEAVHGFYSAEANAYWETICDGDCSDMDDAAKIAAELRAEIDRLRGAMCSALHELASQRVGAAMTLIEGALKDGDA